MFEYFVTIYNHNCSSDEQWKETQQLVSQELIWETLLAKLKSLNKNRYYFALLDFETLTMGKLIKAIHSFVAQDDFYKELYGKNNSDKHTDLIISQSSSPCTKAKETIIISYYLVRYRITIYWQIIFIP